MEHVSLYREHRRSSAATMTLLAWLVNMLNHVSPDVQTANMIASVEYGRQGANCIFNNPLDNAEDSHHQPEYRCIYG